MATITVDIKGLDGNIRNSGRILGRGMSNAIRKITVTIQAKSRPFVPVDTGFLRNSVNVEIQTFLGKVEARTPYAIFVHEGTSKMEARPFFKKGIAASEQDMNRILSREMDKSLNEIFA